MSRNWFMTNVDTIVDLNRMDGFKIKERENYKDFVVCAEEGCRDHLLGICATEDEAQAYLSEMYMNLQGCSDE